jgi:hypothetical protein
MSVDNDNSSSDDFNATISNEPEVGDIGYIDNATLLQVDVTAIVGIFIFLTLKQLSHDQSDRVLLYTYIKSHCYVASQSEGL